MAVVTTSAIDKTKIKFRFAEPYASEGANIQAGVNLAGAYRGGLVKQNSPAGQSFLVGTEENESIILHRNKATGICTVVRLTSDVVMNLGGLVWPIVSETTLAVFVDVDYDTGVETEGYIGVVDSLGEVPTNGVMLGIIVLPAGATSVLNSYVNTSGGFRAKVARKRGVICRKMLSVSASPGRTRFQIPDKVSFVNSLDNKTRVSIRAASNQFFAPLRGSDGGQIAAGAWYADEVGGSPIGPGSLDGDQCYQNPWIELNFANTVDVDCDDAFNAIYYAYVPFDELGVYNWNVGNIGLHTNEVWGKSHTGTPDSLSTDTLVNQIATILSLINGRIRKFYPVVATSVWQLLWRSNNVVNDADVTRTTLSIYWNQDGLAIAQGGYLGNDGQWKLFVPSGSSTGDVSLFTYALGDSKVYRKDVAAVPAELRLNVAADWDTFEFKTGDTGDEQWGNTARRFLFDQYMLMQMNGLAATVDNPTYINILNLANGNIWACYGGSAVAEENEFVLSFGCKWYDSSAKWVATSGTAMDAYALKIGRNAVSLMRKSKDDADYGTGWTAFSNYFSFDYDGAIPRMFTRNMPQRILVPFKVVMSEAYVRAMRDPAYTGPTLYEVVNFMRRHAIPTSFAWAKLSGGENTLTSLTVSDATTNMAKVSGQIDIRPHLDQVEIYSTLSSGTIVVSGYHPISVGMKIALRGTGQNSSWTITAIAYSTTPDRTELDVDLENGDNPVLDDAYPTDLTGYLVFPENDGAEKTAFYEVLIGD